MKHKFVYLLGIIFLSGCGQMGPLYLPNQKPPVYVPKPKKETKTEANTTATSDSTARTSNS